MILVAAPGGPTIHLDLFEGPLELLLNLVERRRLPITEVSLATVADQYLCQVRALESVDPQALADFLQMAARLLLIKSRALLPVLVSSNDERDDPAGLLVERLEAYRIVKLLAASLAAREQMSPAAFVRGPVGGSVEVSTTEALAAFPPDLLTRLLRQVEARAPAPAQPATVLVTRASVAERILHLRERLTATEDVAWTDVAGATVDTTVATLLAVLEMLRRGELSVHQDTLFGPITLRGIDQPLPMLPA
ncbi:MAG: segregation/condensation protein A [Chloroflexi bacterium]|nr:segregation/condensation protein A [Chloroflexota bacterium]